MWCSPTRGYCYYPGFTVAEFVEYFALAQLDAGGGGATGLRVAGRIGSAVKLNGTADYVSLPVNIESGLSDFTGGDQHWLRRVQLVEPAQFECRPGKAALSRILRQDPVAKIHCRGEVDTQPAHTAVGQPPELSLEAFAERNHQPGRIEPRKRRTAASNVATRTACHLAPWEASVKRDAEHVLVELPRFDAPDGNVGLLRRGVPASRAGDHLVTTVFDLLMAQYGVRRDGLEGGASSIDTLYLRVRVGWFTRTDVIPLGMGWALAGPSHRPDMQPGPNCLKCI